MSFSFNKIKKCGINRFLEWFPDRRSEFKSYLQQNLDKFIADRVKVIEIVDSFPELKSAVSDLIAKNLNKFCKDLSDIEYFVENFPELKSGIQNFIKPNLARFIICAEYACDAIEFFPDLKSEVDDFVVKNLEKFCINMVWVRYFVEKFSEIKSRIQNFIKQNLARFIVCAEDAYDAIELFPDLKSAVSDLIAKDLNKFCDIFWIKYFVENFPKLRQKIQVCIIQHLDEIYVDLPRLSPVDSNYIKKLINEQIKSELFCKSTQNPSQLIKSKIILEKLPVFYGNQISHNCGYWVIDRLQSIFIFWGYKHHFFPAQPSDMIGYYASLMEIGMTLRINEDIVNSSKWGLFNPDQFALIVRQIGYECIAYHANDKDELQFLIDQILTAGLPVAIPYDVNDGQPVKHCGESAHWGIIVGVFKLKSNGKSYYIYTNSHAINKNFDFCSADCLCESCGQLGNHPEVTKQFKLKNNIIVMLPKTFEKN
ncbi:MAG: hypothetical protein PVG30_01620 [Gammaproteobacteria bacterium]|jgi:hypothetical protein